MLMKRVKPTTYGGKYLKAGDTVDVSEATANRWQREGVAVPAGEPKEVPAEELVEEPKDEPQKPPQERKKAKTGEE